jgi:type IV pilus assembly protein PilM
LFETVLGIKKPTFGLDIGYKSMKLVQVKGAGAGAHLLSAIEVPLEPNTLSKSGIKNKENLAQVLRQAMTAAKPHAISAKIVSSALPESLVFTKILDLPKMTQTELDKNIPYQATEFFPIPADETYMDWQVVGGNQDKNTMEVMVVAAPKILANSIEEVIHLAGLELMGLETKPMAVARAIIAKGEPGPFLIIDIGAITTCLTCYDQQTIKLTSTTAFGGDNLQTNFAPTIKNLASEIIHIIKYYQNRIGAAQVFGKIILAGGGASIEKVPE